MKRFLRGVAAIAPVFLASPALADCDVVALGPGAGDALCDGSSVFHGPDAVETRSIQSLVGNTQVTVQGGAQIDTTAIGTEPAISLGQFGLGGHRVFVESGASIRAATNAITVGIGSEVENDGSLRSTLSSVVSLTSRMGSVSARPLDLLDFAGQTLVTNGRAAYDAFVAGDSSALPTASIRSEEGYGVGIGPEGAVWNYGTLSGAWGGVGLHEAGVTNAGGVIENTASDLAASNFGQTGAVTLTSGGVTNLDGATIRSTLTPGIVIGLSGATSLGSSVQNSGTITGTIGINVLSLDEGAQTVLNMAGGVIEGTTGLALDLGQGDDNLLMLGGSLIGGADFGTGADTLWFLDGYTFLDDFAGGALMEGGDGVDTLRFDMLDETDLTVASHRDGRFSFLIFGEHSLLAASWESFVFAGGVTRSAAELAARVAPVPLPASGALLLMGLCALGLRRRRITKP